MTDKYSTYPVLVCILNPLTRELLHINIPSKGWVLPLLKANRSNSIFSQVRDQLSREGLFPLGIEYIRDFLLWGEQTSLLIAYSLNIIETSKQDFSFLPINKVYPLQLRAEITPYI